MATISEEKRSVQQGVGHEVIARVAMTAESSFTVDNVPAHADKTHLSVIALEADGTVHSPTDIDHASGTDTVTFGAPITATAYYRSTSPVR